MLTVAMKKQVEETLQHSILTDVTCLSQVAGGAVTWPSTLEKSIDNIMMIILSVVVHHELKTVHGEDLASFPSAWERG